MDIPESRRARTVVPLRRTDAAEMAPTAETFAALQTAFDHLNTHLFGGDLPNALVTLTRRGRSPGCFRAGSFERADGVVADEITMTPARFRDRPPAEPLAQLAHDMVHLWQRAFGTPGRGGYHNREWAAKMVSIGLQPTATSEPGGKATGERMGQMLIPGGAFADAVAALLDMGFTIPWAAREKALPRAGEGADDDEPAVPKSGRWFKYVCPACGAIARAKHGASLVCGDDYVVMDMEP
ncbi:sprT domain-containing protein [Roseospira visakhapatnamensis]|uniref:SprT-like family protein n=1 Tax=Roseospira visakhapatnamensis TaxID=390880 RepID=A0A7W6RGA2_9PROT|nr:sprT domain-containing protein [Roseospira visakhapatnamensis]MBB4267907.1 hypothetical protein [Roseospira visakhapatnamensis]